MADTLLQALGALLTFQHLAYMLLGVSVGLVIGVIPGLGGIAGLSLVLPFIYGMDPVSGLALMVGMIAVIPTSDTFSSVLLGIPGSSSSAGDHSRWLPVARQGQAARALSAAFICSLYGGLISAVVLTCFIFIARPLILAFGLPEMLMLTVLGMSMVAILAGRVPLKGAVAAGVGLLAGTIGAAGAGGSLRMSTYDIPYLVDGLQLIIVGLGIYAIPEIVSLLREDESVAKGNALGAGWRDGIRDWWRNRWLSTKGAMIGVVIGIIPGLGGSVVDWIAYGYTVQSSKDRSCSARGISAASWPGKRQQLGRCAGAHADLRHSRFRLDGGVSGRTCAAEPAGAAHGASQLDITYTIVWSLAIANVIGASLCILLKSKYIARLTTIRFTLLAPHLFMLIAFAAFQSRQSIGATWSHWSGSGARASCCAGSTIPAPPS